MILSETKWAVPFLVVDIGELLGDGTCLAQRSKTLDSLLFFADVELIWTL